MSVDAPIPMLPDPTAKLAAAHASAANALYGATVVDEGAASIASAAAERVDLTSRQQDSEVAHTRVLLERYSGGSAAIARDLGDALAIGARGAPVTAEQAEAWKAQSEAWLRSEFGDRAGDVLAKAAALVKADPALSRRLTSGLGNHPAVLRAVVAKAAKR